MWKKPTCFKNPAKPTYIDLIITNKPGMFQNAKTYETCLSDFHKLVVSIMKVSYKKRLPHGLIFQVSILKFKNNTKLDYNSFEEIVLNLLSSQGPFKKRMVRANQRVFINEEIHKAIMVRSRLRNVKQMQM